MKKAIILLLALVMTLSFCACGGGSTAINITLTDGTEKTFESPMDLITAYQENEVANEELYMHAEATVEGNIEEIEATKRYVFGIYKDVVSVKLEGDCYLYFDAAYEKPMELVKAVNVGDYVKAVGTTADIEGTFIALSAYEMEHVEF